jgi:hypothetical protein
VRAQIASCSSGGSLGKSVKVLGTSDDDCIAYCIAFDDDSGDEVQSVKVTMTDDVGDARWIASIYNAGMLARHVATQQNNAESFSHTYTSKEYARFPIQP